MSKTTAVRRINNVGGSLNDSVGGVIHADAPPHYRWRFTGTHTASAGYSEGFKGGAWSRLAQKLHDGIAPCPEGGDDECRTAGCKAWRSGE